MSLDSMVELILKIAASMTLEKGSEWDWEGRHWRPRIRDRSPFGVLNLLVPGLPVVYDLNISA